MDWSDDSLYWRDGRALEGMGFMTYEMYLHDYSVFAGRTKLRQGQLAYNVLSAIRPGLARSINASALDPFHSDEALPDFFAYIEAHWNDSFSE